MLERQRYSLQEKRKATTYGEQHYRQESFRTATCQSYHGCINLRIPIDQRGCLRMWQAWKAVPVPDCKLARSASVCVRTNVPLIIALLTGLRLYAYFSVSIIQDNLMPNITATYHRRGANLSWLKWLCGKKC